uniref:Uncharacterized protein n=1 Tax=Ascaris lumbricoides TaxID=6252 RepID=A0A9J2P2X1_ASCLU
MQPARPLSQRCPSVWASAACRAAVRKTKPSGTSRGALNAEHAAHTQGARQLCGRNLSNQDAQHMDAFFNSFSETFTNAAGRSFASPKEIPPRISVTGDAHTPYNKEENLRVAE